MLPDLDNIKGEFVIVVSGYDGSVLDNKLSIIDSVNLYVNDGIDVKDAIKMVAKDKNIPKSDVYREYHMGR